MRSNVPNWLSFQRGHTSLHNLIHQKEIRRDHGAKNGIRNTHLVKDTA